jgi:hypothetical protein
MLVAVGDSITAHDPDVPDDAGVPYRPWPSWLADALELPCLTVARPGATAPQVADELVGRGPDGCAVGARYGGVNDVRSPDWDPAAFATALDVVTRRLFPACAQVVMCTVPLDLGRPRAGAKVADCNALIAAAAAGIGARVCRLEDLAGQPWLQDDAVHPTATGQREIAGRLARTLGLPTSRGSVPL